MSSIFPIRDTVTRDEKQEPRLVDLDEDTADEVFEALAASTTRQMFLSLHDQPKTASDLAEETDTSVQNIQYHLEKLQNAELVDVVDTWYSERGSEMNVYAPNDESLVLYAGRDKQRSFRSILDRLVGALSVLVPPSLLAGWLAGRSDSDEGAGAGDVEDGDVDVEAVDLPEGGVEPEKQEQGDGVGIAQDGNETEESDVYLEPSETNGSEVIISEEYTGEPILITDGGNATRLSNETVSGTTEATVGIDPALAAGLAFFCGGLFVLLSLWAWYGTPE